MTPQEYDKQIEANSKKLKSLLDELEKEYGTGARIIGLDICLTQMDINNLKTMKIVSHG